MGQVNFVQLAKQWQAFADIVGTIDEDVEYLIQNRGNDPLVALEASETPAATTQAGIIIYPTDMAVYKKGEQNLYLRAFNLNCSINVSTGD